MIYADGSCLSNPSPRGGWAFVIEEDNHYEIHYGSHEEEHSTTNNVMEKVAILKAVAFADTLYESAFIHSDSQVAISQVRKEGIQVEWIAKAEKIEPHKLADKFAKLAAKKGVGYEIERIYK